LNESPESLYKQLAAIYGLDKIKDHTWHLQPCSAKIGEGLYGRYAVDE
jgi:hypothetical protein